MDGTKRPRRKRRQGVEGVKNVLILLLTLSAVYLTTRALTYTELAGSAPRNWLGSVVDLLGGGEAPAPVDTGSAKELSLDLYPVRMAVYLDGDRFAVQYDTEQTDKLFDQTSTLLSEALAGAKTPAQIQERTWRQALRSPGVWFDFLGDIPLKALYAWLSEGGVNPTLSGSARQLAVACDASGKVALYYHNEADGLYYACETGVVYEGHMDEILEGHGDNSTDFVFEYEQTESYAALDPYALIASAPPSPLVYRASDPLAGIDQSTIDALQKAVSFRPQSNSVYPVPEGIRVREGQETLLIGKDGTVVYSAAGREASRYPIQETGGILPDWLTATWTLAADTVGSYCGSARLCLLGAEQREDGALVVSYGYLLDGAEVILADGGHAAEFVIQDGQITDYTLRFRSYEATGEHSLVLREVQAAAAMEALEPEGRELMLCYSDNGGDTVRAGWVAR